MKFFLSVIFVVLAQKAFLVNAHKKCEKQIDFIFFCPKVGNFDDLADPTCTKYYECTRHLLLITAKHMTCPQNQYFNPVTGQCCHDYICPCLQSTTTTTIRTTTPSCYVQTEPYVCKSIGLFPDPTDPTCSRYITCISILFEYKAITLQCLKGFKFDPFLRLCNLFYQCPCKPFPTTTTTTIETVTATPQQCSANNPNFECRQKGRFVDSNDLTCTKYYLCSLLNDGSFVKTKYTCPQNSFFNPTAGLCDQNYGCPCISTSTEDISTTTTTTKKTITTEESITTSTEEPTPSTTKQPTTSTTTTLRTSTLDQCTGSNNPNFECAEKGRFAQPNDLTCTKYFLCSQLNDGSFIKTPYKCPQNSFFDPSIGMCKKDYNCPCEAISTTTKGPITTTTEEPTTTTLKTTTPDQCIITDNPNFQCTKKGRFAQPNDLTCTKYFLCSQLNDGSFIKTPYKCPQNSFFDPSIGMCKKDYNCPCEAISTTTEGPITTTTEEPTTTTLRTTTPDQCKITDNPNFQCTKKGRFAQPNDLTCTKYFLCSQLNDGSFIKTPYKCPQNSFFDPSIGMCKKDYNCPCEAISTTTEGPITTTTEEPTTTTLRTTTPDQCIITENPNFQCTEKGRFAQPNDLTCTKYFLCSQLNDGSFIKTPYKCPQNSFFDPSIGMCKKDYNCPCEAISTTTEGPITTTTEEPTTTTLRTTTPDQCKITDNPNFQCTKKGRFAQPNDLTCTKYFLCSQLNDGSFIKTPYKCPQNSFFDPSIGMCKKDYNCPCEAISTTTEGPITTTTEEPTATTLRTTTPDQCIITDNPNFQCTEKGRFAQPNDLTCTKYFLCSQLNDGSFIKTPYKCPQNSFFDPSIGMCKKDYNCPCEDISTTTKKLITTTTEEPTTLTPIEATTSTTEGPAKTTTAEPISTTTEEASCSSTKEPTTTTILPDQCNTAGNSDFDCEEQGRFFQPNDLTCTKYFLCSPLRNGSFIKTPYTCPKNSFFDPSIGMCNKDYNCPCEIIATTTEEPTTTSILPDQCKIVNNPDFTCEEKGRFFQPNDFTCTKYFLCSPLRNGSFIKTPYTCPKNSFFDPSIGMCNIDYDCPCETIATTTEPTSTIIVDPTTSSTEEPNSTTTEEPTLPDQCQITNNLDFECKEKGRFFQPNDLTCTMYFLCSPLRNGSFIKTSYTCPKNSFFDPSIGICNIEFNCPCERITTAYPVDGSTTEEELVHVSTDPTEFSSSTEEPTPSTEEVIETTSGLTSTTTEEEPIYVSTDNTGFLNDLSTISSGKPASSSEQPIETSSDLLPVTSEEEPVYTNSNPTSLTTIRPTQCVRSDEFCFECTEKGRFPEPTDFSCSLYYICTKMNNGSFIQTPYKCRDGLKFDPIKQDCIDDYICPNDVLTTTTTEVVPIPIQCVNPDNSKFKCTTKGNYPAPGDSNCESYYRCTALGNGEFIETLMKCSNGKYFDPKIGSCIESFKCPCDTCDLPREKFVCDESGNFRHDYDLSCSKYYVCELLSNGEYFKIEYSCPQNMSFDPVVRACSNTYKCACKKET